MSENLNSLEYEFVQVERAHDEGPIRPTITSALDLCRREFPPIKFVVPGYLTEGCTILAGAPKIGKSWLCMEIALAVASGGTCLGSIQSIKGDVLYLALEDNERRLQSRINKLWQAEGGSPVPENLHLATTWPRANQGGIEAIRDWISDHPDARLVIVDVLAMFRPVGRLREQSLYENDYQAIKGLQSLAIESGIAIVIVHHTRKSAAEVDPFEKVSGTLGLSGGADSVLILDRVSNGVTIYGRGRDLDQIENAVRFDPQSCKWIELGDASEVHRTDQRSAILQTLTDNRTDNRTDNQEPPEPMSPAELADALGLPRNNVKQLLFKMARAGEVVKVPESRGKYTVPYGYQDD